MTFGRKLKGLIEERNITQKELSKELNIAPSTISCYVQNTREPDFETLKKIAFYFRVSVDYLLSVKNETSGYMEDELLRVFHSMNNIQRETFVEQGKAIISISNKYNNEQRNTDESL